MAAPPSFFESLLRPLTALGAPNARVFLPYLVMGAVLAALVWWRTPRPKAHRASLARYLFPWRLFRHPSSRFDVKFLFVRAPLRWLGALPLAGLRVAVMLTLFGWLRTLTGTSPDWFVSREVAVALFSVAAFVADDFTRYLLHRWMHRSAALWEIHKLHHSAEVLTPLTLYRVHPLEGFLNQVRSLVTLAVVSALAMWCLPGRLHAWDVLGVELLGFLWNLLGANLRHSHVWLTFGRWGEHLFLSPAQHQLHHSRERDDTNYGAALSWWDWLGGSLEIASGKKPPRVGLAGGTQRRYRSVLDALVSPLVDAGRVLTRRLGATKPATLPRPAENSSSR